MRSALVPFCHISWIISSPTNIFCSSFFKSRSLESERIVCPGASSVSQNGAGREKEESCSMLEIFTMQGPQNNLSGRIHRRMKIDWNTDISQEAANTLVSSYHNQKKKDQKTQADRGVGKQHSSSRRESTQRSLAICEMDEVEKRLIWAGITIIKKNKSALQGRCISKGGKYIYIYTESDKQLNMSHCQSQVHRL